MRQSNCRGNFASSWQRTYPVAWYYVMWYMICYYDMICIVIYSECIDCRYYFLFLFNCPGFSNLLRVSAGICGAGIFWDHWPQPGKMATGLILSSSTTGYMWGTVISPFLPVTVLQSIYHWLSADDTVDISHSMLTCSSDTDSDILALLFIVNIYFILVLLTFITVWHVAGISPFQRHYSPRSQLPQLSYQRGK